MKDTSSFGPKQLLVILSTILMLMIAGLVVGIIFSQNYLSGQSIELAKKLDEQAVRQLSPESKKIIQDKLKAQKPYIDKIENLYAKPESADSNLFSILLKYAEKADIEITSKTISNTTLPMKNAKAADIGLRVNTKYANFIKFLTYVEKSSPKLQVINMNLKRATSGKSDEIDVTNLTIAIYYK